MLVDTVLFINAFVYVSIFWKVYHQPAHSLYIHVFLFQDGGTQNRAKAILFPPSHGEEVVHSKYYVNDPTENDLEGIIIFQYDTGIVFVISTL